MVLDVAAVCERFGVQRPEQVIDLLGLAGDSTDNIPGVPGVGEKTAQKLLAQFGTVEALVAGVDQLKGKQREKIETYAAQALLSKSLATIDRDLELDVDPDTFATAALDPERVIPLFQEFEFTALINRVFGDAAAAAATAAGAGATRARATATASSASTAVSSAASPATVTGAVTGTASGAASGAATGAASSTTGLAAEAGPAALPLGTPDYPERPAALADTAHDYRPVDGAAERAALCDALRRQQAVSLYVVSEAGDPKTALLTGVAFSGTGQRALPAAPPRPCRGRRPPARAGAVVGRSVHHQDRP